MYSTPCSLRLFASRSAPLISATISSPAHSSAGRLRIYCRRGEGTLTLRGRRAALRCAPGCRQIVQKGREPPQPDRTTRNSRARKLQPWPERGGARWLLCVGSNPRCFAEIYFAGIRAKKEG